MKALWDDSTWEKLLNEPAIKEKVYKIDERSIVNKRDIDVLQRLIITLVEDGILTREQVIEAKKKADEAIKKEHPDF